MPVRHCIAVDLGASSGRVMLARFDSENDAFTLHEIHRFTNALCPVDGFDTWDVDALFQEILTGLNRVCEQGIIPDSIGIDTWGVDMVLIDKAGHRVGLPVSYRDSRTDGVMAQALNVAGKKEDIYQRTGIQFLPFNTLWQFRAIADQQPQWLEQAEHALLIPDYFSFLLTGNLNWEYTNATTTQMVNINSDNWDDTLLAWSGAPRRLFGTPTHPGNVIGHWRSPKGDDIPVVSVASHDTASAVIAAPLLSHDAAYLSSGTWSLMGFESRTPDTGETALAANITNEGGAEGRYRVLKNIMGLWLLQRVIKEQQITDLPDLITRASQLPACQMLINPNEERFINPENMTAAIQQACAERGQKVPQSDAELARCIFDSLALLYADVLHELAVLRGTPFTQLHIVGGGCQNPLLNQLCADACGIPVIAGPVEASTLGNIAIQLMTLDDIRHVGDFRKRVTARQPLVTFTPNSESEIARHVAQFQQQRPSKELCA